MGSTRPSSKVQFGETGFCFPEPTASEFARLNSVTIACLDPAPTPSTIAKFLAILIAGSRGNSVCARPPSHLSLLPPPRAAIRLLPWGLHQSRPQTSQGGHLDTKYAG